jgi:hypothetical protein
VVGWGEKQGEKRDRERGEGFKGTDLRFRVILSKRVTLHFSITDFHITDNN